MLHSAILADQASASREARDIQTLMQRVWSGREACLPWSLGPLCRELSRTTAEPKGCRQVDTSLRCLWTQAMEKHQIRRNFLVEDGIAAFEGTMHCVTIRNRNCSRTRWPRCRPG